MFRCLHSADLHLGKTFGQIDAEVRGRLTEARIDVLATLAARARDAGARHILLAGDTWDGEVPSARVLRQSLAAMASADDLTWVLLPGNHDPAREGGLWERIAAEAPENVTALIAAEPVALTDDVWILPAPCVGRDPGRDPTAWMDAAATPEGAHRIGIAHGPVTEFGDGGGAMIDPGRAASAGLDYLALGDWHGWVAVGPRTLYPGTPEPDRYREGSGRAAAVSAPGGGTVPEIVPVETARFAWIPAEIDAGLEAPDEAAARLVPAGRARRDVLMSLSLTGMATLARRAEWVAAETRLSPGFADFRLDMAGLGTLTAADDLDAIDRHGALRAAAQTLRAEADDPARDPAARATARRALDLLYSWSVADADTPAEADAP